MAIISKLKAGDYVWFAELKHDGSFIKEKALIKNVEITRFGQCYGCKKIMIDTGHVVREFITSNAEREYSDDFNKSFILSTAECEFSIIAINEEILNYKIKEYTNLILEKLNSKLKEAQKKVDKINKAILSVKTIIQ